MPTPQQLLTASPCVCALIACMDLSSDFMLGIAYFGVFTKNMKVLALVLGPELANH